MSSEVTLLVLWLLLFVLSWHRTLVGLGAAILLAAFTFMAGTWMTFFGLMWLGANDSAMWLVCTALGVLVSLAPVAWKLWLGLKWLRIRAAKLGSAADGVE